MESAVNYPACGPAFLQFDLTMTHEQTAVWSPLEPGMAELLLRPPGPD
jgi:hypothetical protein